MPAIHISGVERSYDTAPVLRGVDLTIERGELFALLGPNGAGKTTLVEILEGYRDRDAGQVDVLGVDPRRATAAWRARLGIVLQETTAFEKATVDETISMFGRLHGAPRTVGEVSEMVDLRGLGDRLLDTLSGGERRRVDVACALVGRPDVLFLDEPTTGLDPEARRLMWITIDALRDEGVTVLLTTHYLDEAEYLADRIGVLLGGRLVDVARPDRLGGRDTAPSQISYRDADGERVQLSTRTPARAIAELVERTGREPDGLTVRCPTLDDVYLEMVRTHGDRRTTTASTGPEVTA